jgi:cytidyltransferase-like protein
VSLKSKIAVFGGSFNPPTKSHQRIIKDFSKIFKEVWVVPVFSPPHKNNLISFEHRKIMLEMIAEDMPNVKILDVDKKIAIEKFKKQEGSVNYTYETMQELRKNSKDELIFATGPDVDVSKYKNSHEIGQFYIYENNFQERSTVFREAFSEQDYEKARSVMPISIWDYIIEKKLFDPEIKVAKKKINDGYLPLLELDIEYDPTRLKTDVKISGGQSYKRNIIDPKNSIGITLIDPVNNKVLIKREKRFGPYIEEGKLFSYGVIEGTMEKNECPIECAIRETEEESGIVLERDKVVLINKWYPSAGYMTEIKHVLVGFFDINQYKEAGDKHGLLSENEEIYTEIFDIDEVLFYHAVPGSSIYSPEIAAALLYYKFGKSEKDGNLE